MLLCVGLGALAVVWLGAVVAAVVVGSRIPPLDATPGAVVRLVERPTDTRSAWPRGTGAPPGVAWPATLVTTAVVGVVGFSLARGLHEPVGSARRNVLGVDAKARYARRRDLAPLHVRGAVSGRFILGRHGRQLLATEDGRQRGPRRGDRGAVALIGPSRSGKTSAAITGILGWDGPAVLSSVKGDLLGATIDERRRVGDVRLYDPTGSTGRLGDGRWSPIHTAATTIDAQRAARSLCDAAPKSNVEGGLDFWLAQAEILLSGLLYVAHHTSRDMSTIAGWILTQDRPGPGGPGELATALDALAETHPDSAGVGEASQALNAIWAMEERTRSSVYATAQTVVWPWSDPGVASAAREPNVTLDWLTSGANTAYLCAPIEDQRRLAPAFGGLLNGLIKDIYLRTARTGQPLDPPLLIVIDEAGNTPLRSLPEYASTLAGLGVVLVTIWQSLAQIDANYPRQGDTIMTNHTTKAFFAGQSDPSSLRYLSQVLGDVEVDTRSRSVGQRQSSVQLATARTSLAPPHTVRQMRPGDALLIHGTLPPAHITTVPYYRAGRMRR